jgi:hypothetical protein
LEGITPTIKPRLKNPDGMHRVNITTSLPESVVAEYLTQLAARLKKKDVDVGSYPQWDNKNNTITLTGT